MRYLKVLGLAAVAAAALMAFAGAGTASAETTACATTTEPCTSGYGVGTKVKETGTALLTSESFFGGNVECKSHVEGEIETATTPSGKATVNWTECNAETVSTITNGTITLHHDGTKKEELHNGLVTLAGFVVHVKKNGVSCLYGGEVNGTLKAGATPIAEVTSNVHKINEHTLNGVTLKSSFLCPAETVWHATYEVIEPKPLYITTGV